MLRVLLAVLIAVPGTAFADERIVGVWMNTSESIRLHILDGFRPNRGVVLFIQDDDETALGTWETKASATTMQVDWESSTITFLAQNAIRWNGIVFEKQENLNDRDFVQLGLDKVGFIDRLTKRLWRTSTEGDTSLFKSTFSSDSGVVETTSEDGDLKALDSWGIASGVLNVGGQVIVAARVSSSYLIGLNDWDEFVMFQAIGPVRVEDRAGLASERSKFLSLLLTDSWHTVSYDEHENYVFRPIEGPFKGRRFQFRNGKLQCVDAWEYSPSTGALKIGLSEYLGGLVVGDTLALIDDSGYQVFYKRKPGGEGKEFTIADVRPHEVNEIGNSEIMMSLSGQFQKASYLYAFEFNEDNRTGYLHKWRSEPFTIAGHEWVAEFFQREEGLCEGDTLILFDDFAANPEKVYEVEDFVIFGDRFALQRDATESRMRSKTQPELRVDKVAIGDRLEEAPKRGIILSIRDSEGRVQNIELPYSSLGDISQIQFITQ